MVELLNGQQVVKPQNDKREYRKIKLENELKVFLVSDSETEKAAACVDVHVGWLSDPWDLLGLAHFTEHMLLVSSSKYPDEDGFKSFVDLHGGSSNAFTSAEHTCYVFSVNHDHLEGGLDRMADFMDCPLLVEDAVDREVKAVNSEFSKNWNSDGRRRYQLLRHHTNPSHVFSRFTSGNSLSLEDGAVKKGVALHKAVRAFYEEEYSSNLMSLCVYGRESLDALEEMVRRLFSRLQSKNLPAKDFPGEVVLETQKGILVKSVPVKDEHVLYLQWFVLPTRDTYKYAACHYISHLLGDEGTGSAFALLKKLGYASALYAGESGLSFKNRGMFVLNVELTEKGQENAREVLDIVFSYITLLKADGGISRDVFDEMKALDEMRFNFRDKSEPYNAVQNAAMAVHLYDTADILRGGIPQEFNHEAIKNILEDITPRNVRIHWSSKSFQDGADEVEPWYGTQFTKVPIPEEWILGWETAGRDPRLHFPKPNDFIPTDFGLIKSDTETAKPELILDGDLLKMWHLDDVSFDVPKTVVYFQIENPQYYSTPEAATLSELFVALVLDSLNELAYPADLAGLKYFVNATTLGITICVSGYSHKLNKLLEAIFATLFHLEVNEERFNIIHEEVKRELANAKHSQVYSWGLSTTQLILEHQRWHVSEYLAAIDNLGLSELKEFMKGFLSRISVKGFATGNIGKEDATKLGSDLALRLKDEHNSRPLSVAQKGQRRCIKVPVSNCLFTEPGPNSENENSAVVVTYQVAKDDIRLQMLAELLVVIGKTEAFKQLRTVEQLGYIVFMTTSRVLGVHSVRFIIQSSDYSAQHLDERIESFIHQLEKYLKDMDAQTFSAAVNELVKAKLEKPKRLTHKAVTYWREISDGTFVFDRKELLAQEVAKLTIEDVLMFLDQYVKNENQRRKLSVHVKGAKELANDGTEAADQEASGRPTNAVVIEDIWRFKRRCELFSSM